MTFDFGEISDHKKFEELAVSYFEDLKHEKGHGIVDVDVKPSGTGVDGGRDILVTLKVSDGVVTFERRWVVQCKFHDTDISTDKIADINIPTLLASYNASGYLLICKLKPTSKLTTMFENMEKENHYGQRFIVWSGEQFKRLILVKSKKEIIQQFFPSYFEYCITHKIFAK